MNKPAIHYVVKAKHIINKEGGEINFVNKEIKFEDKNPIEARKKAFSRYQSYIEVLIGEENVSDREARKSLKPFLFPDIQESLSHSKKVKRLIPMWDNCLCVNLVIDQPLDDEPYEEYAIYDITKHPENIEYLDELSLGLQREDKYYDYFEYDKGNKIDIVSFFNPEDEELDTFSMLKTPFDWTGLDKPYWWLDEDEKEEILREKVEEDSTIRYLKSLIENGETKQVEFKPTMLYHFDKGHYSNTVRYIIAKTISSFLNAKGGFLFVGVNDDKSIQGLDNDFSLVMPKNKDPKDYFRLQVDKIIRQFFKPFANNIDGEFIKIEGKDVFVFKVEENKSGPSFIEWDNEKQFFVRLTTSSEPYRNEEDIKKYCQERWSNQSK